MQPPSLKYRRVELQTNIDEAQKRLDDFYERQQRAYGVSINKNLQAHQQALDLQKQHLENYIRSHSHAYKLLSRTIIDLNKNMSDDTVKTLKITEEQLKGLPKSVADAIKKAAGEYNDLIAQMQNVSKEVDALMEKQNIMYNESKWNPNLDRAELERVNQQLREKTALYDDLARKADEQNKAHMETAFLEQSKVEAFLEIQDKVYDSHVREIQIMQAVLEKNEELHKERLKMIRNELDNSAKRKAMDQERHRYLNVLREAQNKLNAARSASEGVTKQTSMIERAASTFGIRSSIGNITHLLGMGGVALSFRDVANKLSQAADELRTYSKTTAAAIAVSASPMSPISMYARSQLYRLGRSVESMIEGGEESTMRAGTILGRAGIRPGELSYRAREAVGLGVESGLGAEGVANIFDKMYRRLQIPSNNLAETFVYIEQKARKVGIPLEEMFEGITQLHEATKIYGYSLNSSISLVQMFGHEIRRNIVSIQDLIKVREGLGKIGEGERVFMAGKVIEKLPENVRQGVESLIDRMGGGPLATSQVFKAIVEGQKEMYIRATGETIKIGDYVKASGEDFRKLSLEALRELTTGVSDNISIQNKFFDTMSSTLLGMDLEGKTEEQTKTLVDAFSTATTKLGDRNEAALLALQETLKEGFEFAEKTTPLTQSISAFFTDLYRDTAENIKQTWISIFSGESATELYKWEQLSPTYGVDTKVFESYFAPGKLAAARAGKYKLTQQDIEAAVDSYLASGGEGSAARKGVAAFAEQGLVAKGVNVKPFTGALDIDEARTKALVTASPTPLTSMPAFVAGSIYDWWASRGRRNQDAFNMDMLGPNALKLGRESIPMLSHTLLDEFKVGELVKKYSNVSAKDGIVTLNAPGINITVKPDTDQAVIQVGDKEMRIENEQQLLTALRWAMKELVKGK